MYDEKEDRPPREKDGAAGRLGWGVFLILVGVGTLLDALDVLDVPAGAVLPAALIGVGVRLVVGWRSGGGQPLMALGFVLMCGAVIATAFEAAPADGQLVTLADGQQAVDRGSFSVEGDSVEIVAGDFYFDPTVLYGSPGGRVSMSLRNQGSALHNLRIAAQRIDADVPTGQAVVVDVTFPKSGAVTFEFASTTCFRTCGGSYARGKNASASGAPTAGAVSRDRPIL
jgi:hypothetical protein